MHNINESVVKRGADGFYALRLANLLKLDFTKWKAFQLGIIGEDGVVIRKATTPEEKSNWTLFHVTVANIKKLIHKIPSGKTVLSYGASYLLLIELQKQMGLNDNFPALCESMVSGDSVADGSGETTGSITNDVPDVIEKKKRRLTKFRHFEK